MVQGHPNRTMLVTGSSGLVGSEAVLYFEGRGWNVVGIDNNMRAEFFGPGGDTRWNLDRLKQQTERFSHLSIDIRDRDSVLGTFKQRRPDAIIHCAAQPSHDFGAVRPFENFDINATGTLNLLEAARQYSPDAPFVYVSTNKVYGDIPNSLELVETETRFDYAREEDFFGVDETCGIDQCLHSLMGAAKAAGDLMTQEYGRYFNMPTACFRGGCLTGPAHSGVELHGFLSYLVRAAVQGIPYRVFGYRGKQVRDQIHSFDLIRAFEAFIEAPRIGEVYNIGGGRSCNASVLETIALVEAVSGCKLHFTIEAQERKGDHICYISDIRKFRSHYPSWELTRTLEQIVEEVVRACSASS
ncbi:MAG: NAD-dependent epimerase/dehydratase family protein [Bdellovibrionales bacterium]|nr:NAD-dependent epimerase/dehydratase family protein [Bdellovibrionales bacterium]